MLVNRKVVVMTGCGVGFCYLAMIGVNAAQERMEIRGNIKLFGDGSGIMFPDGSKQTTAVATNTEPVVIGNDTVDSQHYVDGSIDGVHLATLTSVDIDSGAIDDTAIGASSASTGAFTTVTASTSVDISGSEGLLLENDETITNSSDGTVLINGDVQAGTGAVAGIFASNGNQDVTLKTGNSTTGVITITDGSNGNIGITPNGIGEVDITRVDIDSGAIDGTAIGASSASTGAFTTLSASGAVDINDGAIDSTTIGDTTPASGAFTTLSASGAVDIGSGAIDDTAIGASSASTGAFTTVTASTSVDISGSTGLLLENDETITNSTNGTVLINGDVKGGTGATAGIFVSNGNQDVTLKTGNSTTGVITITDGANGNIGITPNGTGEVDITKVDINGGAIDSTTIGGTTPASAQFVNVSVAGVTDLSDGSAAAPAMTNTGDADTGIYFSAANTVAVSTAGSAAMIIDATSEISLSNNDSGTSNTLFGMDAGASLDAGSNYNVLIGEDVSDASMNDSIQNVGVGYAAVSALTDGDNNVAVGYQALDSATTGSENVILGSGADISAAGGDNQIVIGFGATGLGDNYAVIGNTDVSRLYVAGDGAGVLYANATIQSSDRRIKKHITDLGVGLDYVRRLRPVRYLKKHPSEYPQDLQDKFYPNGRLRQGDTAEYATPQVGFIAQEVQAVNEHFGVTNNIVVVDEDGFHRMDYEKLIVPLVKAVQELSAKLEQKELSIARQQQQLDRHEAAVGVQVRELKEVKAHLETLLAQREAGVGLVRSRHASALGDPMLWLLGVALAALGAVTGRRKTNQSTVSRTV